MSKISSLSTRTLYLFFILPAFISLAFAQNSQKAEKIHELMQKYSEYQQFNGSVLVAEDGEVLLEKGLRIG